MGQILETKSKVVNTLVGGLLVFFLVMDIVHMELVPSTKDKNVL